MLFYHKIDCAFDGETESQMNVFFSFFYFYVQSFNICYLSQTVLSYEWQTITKLNVYTNIFHDFVPMPMFIFLV